MSRRDRRVQIPLEALPHNVGRFCHLKWSSHQYAVWRIERVEGRDVWVKSKNGEPFRVKAADVCYYRGFEDPWTDAEF